MNRYGRESSASSEEFVRVGEPELLCTGISKLWEEFVGFLSPFHECLEGFGRRLEFVAFLRERLGGFTSWMGGDGGEGLIVRGESRGLVVARGALNKYALASSVHASSFSS